MSAVATDSHAFLAGAVAGIGVALPLGAIGVLIVSEGLHRGWRPAAAAATGVALVDLGYAAVAVAAGTAVTSVLDGRTAPVRLIGAAVLALVAARGLWGLRRPAAATPTDVPDHRVLFRFVALTAVNPLTAVYFVVLTAGLGDLVSGGSAGARFVLGVFVASWAWQLVLAGVGALAGARLPASARMATGLVGYLVVLGYAVRLASTA
jgi:arginine exporter protein ArgO